MAITPRADRASFQKTQTITPANREFNETEFTKNLDKPGIPIINIVNKPSKLNVTGAFDSFNPLKE